MGCGIGFVELTHGPDPPERLHRKCVGKDGCFPAHSRLQIADEVPLIGIIRASLQRLHADRQVHDGRYGTHPNQTGRRTIGELTGEFQRKVSAKRIPGDRDSRNSIALEQLVEDVFHVVRQP
jgi:hypothetical protein